jgi:hypothetical protein
MISVKSFFFAVAVCYLPCWAAAQTAPKLEWQHCYGGSWTDNEGGYYLALPKEHMLIRTADGGYAFCGVTSSNDGDVSGNHVNGFSTADFWLVKTDSKGNILWQKCFGGKINEYPECLIQTSDGGYAICGFTNSHDGDVSDPYSDSVLVNNVTGYKWPPFEGWIVKIDSMGVKQWAHNIGSATGYQEQYSSLIEIPDGFLIVGHSNGADEDWHAHTNDLESPQRPLDALVLRVNRSGEHRWHKLLGGNNSDLAMCVLPCAGGGYIFAGSAGSRNDTDITTGLPGDVTGLHVIDAYRAGGSDVWVVRIDSIGRIIWQKCYGGTGSESATCMIKIPEGYMIAASTTSKDVDVSGNHGAQDAWVFTIDTNGNLLSQKCFGGSNTDIINSIVRMSDGNYAFAGTTISTDGDVSGLHSGVQDSTDGWAGEFSPDLKLLWQGCLGGTMSDILATVIETSDGGLLLNGSTISTNGDVVGLHPGKDGNGKPALTSDVWDVKLASPYASVEGAPVGAGFTNPYPNPAQEEVDLELFHDNTVNKIEFYDLLATPVFPDYHIERTTAVVNVRNIPPGVYMIKVTYANAPLQIRKFVRAGF